MSMNTPSDQLAVLILDRLIGEGLLAQSDREKLFAKLSGGNLKGEDWRLVFELATEKEEQS